MPRDAEKSAHAVLAAICGPSLDTPDWLKRPAPAACGERWPLVQTIYRRLTGAVEPLAMVMAPREHRRADGVFRCRGRCFVFELDETQHFNEHRAATLRAYPVGVPLAFDRKAWLARCAGKQRLERGGWGRPCPPLFPGEGGRHQQQAFRDALADLLPPLHGWLPTLRLMDTDVKAWQAAGTLRERIDAKLARWYP